MQKLVREYLNELKSRQKKRRRTGIAAILLIVLVVGGVVEVLTQYGVAMTGNAKCGLEEHQHSEECYASEMTCGLEEMAGHSHTDACYQTETALICGQEESAGHTHADDCYGEDGTSVCGQEESAGHTHTDDCYQTDSIQICGQEESAGHTHTAECTESQMACGMEEHSHTDQCYIDTEAGVEEAALWEAQYKDTEWKDAWGEDLVTAAQKQIGYKENSDNYTIAEDGSRKGYTRYGQFAGDVYCDWDAAFVNFCIYYAGLEASGIFPSETDTAKWCGEFEKINGQDERYISCLTAAEGYTPEAGDIIFFEKEDEERTSQMGVVSSYNKEKNEIRVIEGNSGNEVKENPYDAGDAHIVRYLKISELEKVYKGTGEEAQDAEEVQPVEAPAEEPEAVQADEVKKEENPEGEDTEGKESEEKQEQDEEGKLSEEELSQVDEVIALIDDIPSPEEIQEKMEALEDDEEEYEKYYLKLQKQVLEAFEAYEALSEAQQEKVTNAEKLLQMDWMKAETLESPEGVMGPDEAYVNSISVTSRTTGTAPWDKEEGRGNDTGAENEIVRTYDTVSYNFTVNMMSWEADKTYKEARVKLEFVLPRTEAEADFDQSAMAWMDTTEGYAPVLTKENRVIDGKETECQVLTCYKLLKPADGNISVVPGNFGENLTIYVKGMHNGETFAPIISAAMEGGTWDGVCQDKEHTVDGEAVMEKKTVTPDPVTVTAAPKYNIRLQSESSYRDIFEFQGTPEWIAQYGDKAANTDLENPIPGRLMKLGIVLQLYNDNAAKGLKGIELPKGPISFDLELSSVYTPTSTSEHGETVDTTETYTLLLWSYGENREVKYGEQNTDGRVLKDERGCLDLAPYHEHKDDREGSDCRDSGTWAASQEKNVIHITVDGYQIDLSHMPVRNMPDGTELYGANIGCFSSGAIWLVQPFNKTTTGTSPDGPEYDVIQDYGAGSFATTAEAKNLKATTVTGEELEEGVDGFKQMVSEDDREVRTLEINLPGAMQNRVRYGGHENGSGNTDDEKESEDGKGWWTGSGVKDIYDGNDYATIGDKLYLKGGFSYASNRVDENQLYLGTNLIRFYGSAIELDGDGRVSLEDGASLNGESGNEFKEWQKDLKKYVRRYYATKQDGEDWTNDWELQHTYEKDLKFYEKVQDIPKGDVCVGILTCFVGPGSDPEEGKDDGYYAFYHQAQVKENKDLIGESFALVSTSRVWTKQMFEDAGKSLDEINLAIDANKNKNIKDWLLESELLDEFHYKSANIEGSAWYTRETYKEDGSGAIGTHNSEWEHWGDTLLIIGYRTSITKNLSQKLTNGEEKNIYNLDSGQRVADFVLQPRTYYEKDGKFDHTTTVTIQDILPEYMTYKEGSAYFGGKYVQSSPDGGQQGSIIEDDSENAVFMKPEKREPKVESNGDGTQTLTWVIENVKVGEPMAPIYYSVNIGDEERPEKEVPIGTTNLDNVAYITAPEDLRDPKKTPEKNSKAGISVTRGSADSFGKYTKQPVVEEDGAIDYVVYFNNNAGQGADVFIMDTMPMNQVSGSNFTGTYIFADWILDISQCSAYNIRIYYTFDEKYKGMTTKDVTKGEVEKWEEAAIDKETGKIAIPEPQKKEDEDGGETLQMHPIAWAVIGELDAGKKVSIDLKIQLDPGASDENKTENNYFVNLLSSGDTTTTTKTPTVRRTLEGLTWIDDNRDGLQSEGEMKLSGVKVELLKQVEEEGNLVYKNVCYPGTNNPIVIETGKQISLRADSGEDAETYTPGRYKFRDLPAGTFAVKFTEGTSDITILKATWQNIGDDSRDSDGEPTNTGSMLECTEIKDIELPDAEKMYKDSIKLYESKYNDSGFYCGADLGLVKKGTEEIPLANVRFKLADSKGSIVQVDKKDSNGYFVVRETDDSKEWILTGDEEDNYAFEEQGTQSDIVISNLLDMDVFSDDIIRNEGIRTVSAMYVETDSKGIINVKGLLPGNYTVSEIQTAAGYQLLEKPIRIKIGTDGRTTVVNLEELGSDVNMDGDNKLTVRNHPLYALPSTGGMGIYWYMFGGVLLMSAAAFITYRNKRREVLRS